MAKIKFGSIITDSRGHVGGHTLKWSRNGNIAQTKQSPTSRLTTKNSTAHSAFGTLSKRWWSTLTPTQRDNWRILASANPRPNIWGDEYPLTGLALFIAINRTLQTAGYTPLDTAPANQTVTGVATLTLTATGPGTVSLAFTPTPAPTDHNLYIFARGNYSPGILNSDGRDQFLLASAESITSPLSLSSAWLSAFGAVHTGRQQLVRAMFINNVNGARSTSVLSTVIAT